MWRNIINDQGSQFFVLTKLVPTLRCSQSMCNMKAFFHFLSYCLCQTDWWEFQLIPPTAHILGKLSVCQVSSNSSMRTTRSCATERHTQDLQPGKTAHCAGQWSCCGPNCSQITSITQHLQLWKFSSQQHHPPVLCTFLDSSGHKLVKSS